MPIESVMVPVASSITSTRVWRPHIRLTGRRVNRDAARDGGERDRGDRIARHPGPPVPLAAIAPGDSPAAEGTQIPAMVAARSTRRTRLTGAYLRGCWSQALTTLSNYTDTYCPVQAGICDNAAAGAHDLAGGAPHAESATGQGSSQPGLQQGDPGGAGEQRPRVVSGIRLVPDHRHEADALARAGPRDCA